MLVMTEQTTPSLPRPHSMTEATLVQGDDTVLLELLGGDGVEKGVCAGVEWVKYDKDHFCYEQAAGG